VLKMKRKIHDNTHLNLDERRVIQIGIENGSCKADIARTIGKDATTVAKEIRRARELKPRNTFNQPVLCGRSLKRNCPRKPCAVKCPLFEEPECKRRDKSPGACNGCENLRKCRFDKYFYNAETAEKKYRNELVESRQGFNLDDNERKVIAETIAPLLKKGQSVGQILSSHPEITVCERSIYNYIHGGIFKQEGVDLFSLKEQVNRKLKKPKYKKREEPANYNGRKYSDYLKFCSDNPEIPTVEMDTLYNSPSGPYLQTFLFEKTAFMVGFIHEEKTNEMMTKGVDLLQERLGVELFSQILSLILTDRGTEFEKAEMFEFDKNGNSRLSIFYCDPMQSSQKPHVENNHNYVRDIIPNRYPMNALTQDDIDLMFCHINSTPRKSLGWKTPFEVLEFLYGERVPELLGIRQIPKDEVILKPQLLYSKLRKQA